MENKKILFVITTYNQSNITRACLESIQKINESYPVDVLLIDDKSTDDTLSLCKELKINFIFILLIQNFIGNTE